MEALTRGKLFPKIVEAYSRPTRIVRGKEMDPDMQVYFLFIVDNSSFGPQLYFLQKSIAITELNYI